MCPIVFTDPIYPLLGGILGSIGLAAAHHGQAPVVDATEQNMNDATFAFMLGISVYVL